MSTVSVLQSRAALGAAFTEALRSEDLEWQKDGICRVTDDYKFFPEGKENAAWAQVAKRMCLDCPILRQCRDWALTRREEFGVWGGLSEKDRKAIWKKWNNQLSHHNH
jgi:WhiB family redox-sensing transcriptional regulator